MILMSLPILIIFSLFTSCPFQILARVYNHNSTQSGIELPDHPSFNVVSSSICTHKTPSKSTDNNNNKVVKLHLKRRATSKDTGAKESVSESAIRDLTRIQTLHNRITYRKNQNRVVSRLRKGKNRRQLSESGVSGQRLMGTLKSGVSVGSGEYFMDVYIGTPPKHFSLILDTGSDLNWIQCEPCFDCFKQKGTFYNPKESSSFENITCNDPRCDLISSPDPPHPCNADDTNQTCPYFYWYGDSSNTTGDFAVETFTVNLTTTSNKNSEFRKIKNVMFGCGHWNRGLFHGAAGLLGLGRGPLSFSSQLQSLHGHSFSYCFVDRNSDPNVTSKLMFGEVSQHTDLNFTSLIDGRNKNSSVDTFYYVGVKSILVGGQVLDIPEETWKISNDGGGGTIIDSGTTLGYFPDPAYGIIRDAFVEKVKGKYEMVKDFPVLYPCYNVSGLEDLELPGFGILFSDGAVWNFPVENYFIRFEPYGVICLAILGTPRNGFSIIGNFQQQNFHVVYDTKKSRLGFAPAKCADI